MATESALGSGSQCSSTTSSSGQSTKGPLEVRKKSHMANVWQLTMLIIPNWIQHPSEGSVDHIAFVPTKRVKRLTIENGSNASLARAKWALKGKLQATTNWDRINQTCPDHNRYAGGCMNQVCHCTRRLNVAFIGCNSATPFKVTFHYLSIA